MKILNLRQSSLTLALAVASVMSPATHAITWQFDELIAKRQNVSIPYYFYVGKGAQWQNVQFHANFETDNHATVFVTYDDKPLYRSDLNDKGELSFSIPPSKSGFHRIDLTVQQEAVFNSNRASYCLQPTHQFTYLNNIQIDYTPARLTYWLSQLPDALFNPQLRQQQPIVAQLKFNPNSALEASMLSRLATFWHFSTPIYWITQQNSANIKNRPANFIVDIQQSNINLKAAQVSIQLENQIPVLRIQYHSAEQLNTAINALLNKQYAQQLNVSAVSLIQQVQTPKWASLRKFESLADLGVSDIQLEDSSRSVSLSFPATWQPTDVLHGQLALRSQSGMLQGSVVQVWLNEYLAGSMSLAKLDATPIDRQFEFTGKYSPNITTYTMRLENSQINSEECLPNAKSALWVDATKSKIDFPHQYKNGVVAVSSSFVSNPIIAINQPDALGMAISLGQVAKKMLLTDDPVALNIARYNPSNPSKINMIVDRQQYQEQLKANTDTLYAAAAQHGFFVNMQNDQFWIITDSSTGAERFMQYWPLIQAQIPDNTVSMYVSEQGDISVLKQMVVDNQSLPIIHQYSLKIIAVAFMVMIVFALILLLWYRSRKKASKSEQE